jgi:hypothetical protein
LPESHAARLRRCSGESTLAHINLLYASGVTDDSFTTPEEAAEAALADIPQKYVRVEGVSYSDDGKSAVVTLLTNEEPYLYPYYVHCVRDDSGGWTETYSSN